MPIRRAVLIVIAAALTVSSCNDLRASIPEPKSITAPAGLSLSVLQYRTDYPLRRMQLKVTNAGSTPVTVIAARLNSTAFGGEAVWRSRDQADETTIAPGSSTDLPAPLPQSACARSTFTSTAQVDLRADDGTAGRTAALPVRDPFDSIQRVHTEDCHREAALRIADLALVAPLRTTTRGGQLIGLLDLRLNPSGRPGTLTVQSIAPTTLLAPVTGESWLVNRAVKAGSGAQTVTLELRPARCDPHAIAEDKLGTVLPLTLHVDEGESGVVTVSATASLKIEIQRFVHDACGADSSNVGPSGG